MIKAIAYDEKKVILAEGKLQSGNGTTHIEAKVEENAWSRKLIYANLEVDDEKDSSVLQVKISATRVHNMIE